MFERHDGITHTLSRRVHQDQGWEPVVSRTSQLCTIAPLTVPHVDAHLARIHDVSAYSGLHIIFLLLLTFSDAAYKRNNLRTRVCPVRGAMSTRRSRYNTKHPRHEAPYATFSFAHALVASVFCNQGTMRMRSTTRSLIPQHTPGN